MTQHCFIFIVRAKTIAINRNLRQKTFPPSKNRRCILMILKNDKIFLLLLLLFFGAFNRVNMVRQGNHFLKYLKIPKKRLCVPSLLQGHWWTSVNLGSRYRISLSIFFLVPFKPNARRTPYWSRSTCGCQYSSLRMWACCTAEIREKKAGPVNVKPCTTRTPLSKADKGQGYLPG